MTEQERGNPRRRPKGKIIKIPVKLPAEELTEGLAREGNDEDREYWGSVHERLKKEKLKPTTVGGLLGGDILGFERMKRRESAYPEMPEDLLEE